MIDGIEVLRKAIENTQAEMEHTLSDIEYLRENLRLQEEAVQALQDALGLAELGAETIQIQTGITINSILGPNVYDQEA